NEARSEVKVPPLQWSEKLEAQARKWAGMLINLKWLVHNPNSPYGENLLLTDMRFTPAMVVATWASESRYYDYLTNSCSGECAHYTQIVWRETQKVGCAVASHGRWDVWVCNYDPPGNYMGEHPY
ncbi:MAG TPA: CAP domain-containing protein, partial [Acidobacteriota bacterium]|nr:CAP domain-containing protein [Acidobacteriota bacterium]